MKFIKKNKFTILVVVIFVVLVIVAAVVKNIFFINTGQPVYGNRLDGSEDVKIEESRYDSLETELKKNEIISSVETNLDGKIINVIVTLKDDASKKDAKKLGDTVIAQFSEKELKFYDIQLFIKKTDAKQNDFPIIGYKHHNKDGWSWTKDRKVTTNEDK